MTKINIIDVIVLLHILSELLQVMYIRLNLGFFYYY